MRRLRYLLSIAAMAVVLSIGFVTTGTTPASACNVQVGHPDSCAAGYDRSCARLGANNPWCLNATNPYYGGRVSGGVVRGGFVFRGRIVERQVGGVYARQPAPPVPVPSPAEIASRVEHKTTSVCVPCIDGYMQNPQTCQCDRVVWHPGPPPQ